MVCPQLAIAIDAAPVSDTCTRPRYHDLGKPALFNVFVDRVRVFEQGACPGDDVEWCR